jgi:hypothetical protein
MSTTEGLKSQFMSSVVSQKKLLENLKKNVVKANKQIKSDRLKIANNMNREIYDKASSKIIKGREDVENLKVEIEEINEMLGELIDSYDTSLQNLNKYFLSGQGRLQFLSAQETMNRYPGMENTNTLEGEVIKQALMPVDEKNLSSHSDKKHNKTKKKSH